MKKSAVVIMMFVMFAGNAFASEACKNSSKASLLSSTKAVSGSSDSLKSAVKGSK